MRTSIHRLNTLILLFLLAVRRAAESRSNQCSPAVLRGSHEAMRARRGPTVGCVALWSAGDG